MERAVAQQYFDALMAARRERRQQLEALLEGNGVAISTEDEGLQALDDWYAEHVEPSPDDPSRLPPRWYAAGFDIGVYLGEAIIERDPNVYFRFETTPNPRNTGRWYDVSLCPPVKSPATFRSDRS